MPGEIPCWSAKAWTASFLRGNVATNRLHSRGGTRVSRGPLVRFLLDVSPVASNLINEDILLAVKQDVGRLVEEAEPQMVIRLVARA